MKSFLEILEKIKEVKGFHSDSDVAVALGMSPQALFNHRKRSTIPIEQISTFCSNEKISLDWLLFGVGTRERNTLDIDGEDFELDVILKWLKAHPQDKKMIFDLVRRIAEKV